jgi:tellurite resistance-related uncharacterized protein
MTNYLIVIKNGAPSSLHEMIDGLSTMNRGNAYTVETTPEHIARLNTRHGRWLMITVVDGAGRPKGEQAA